MSAKAGHCSECGKQTRGPRLVRHRLQALTKYVTDSGRVNARCLGLGVVMVWPRMSGTCVCIAVARPLPACDNLPPAVLSRSPHLASAGEPNQYYIQNGGFGKNYSGTVSPLFFAAHRLAYGWGLQSRRRNGGANQHQEKVFEGVALDHFRSACSTFPTMGYYVVLRNTWWWRCDHVVETGTGFAPCREHKYCTALVERSDLSRFSNCGGRLVLRINCKLNYKSTDNLKQNETG